MFHEVKKEVQHSKVNYQNIQFPDQSARLLAQNAVEPLSFPQCGFFQFKVYVHSNINRPFSFLVPVVDKISSIKQMISQILGIQKKYQILSGFRTEINNDDLVLHQVHRKPHLHVFLLIKSIPSFSRSSLRLFEERGEVLAPYRPAIIFKLQIIDENTNSEYLVIGDNKTTIEVLKIYTRFLTDIQPGNQIWTGWPNNCNNRSFLCNLNLDIPIHYLKVKGTRIPNFLDSWRNLIKRTQPAHIPENKSAGKADEQNVISYKTKLETSEVIDFIEKFNKRFGKSVPQFFPHSLSLALKSSFEKPVKERRILAIYLHNGKSKMSHDFCSKILCSEPILQLLDKHFLVWGWDGTQEYSKVMFLTFALKCIEKDIIEAIHKHLPYPTLVIIAKNSRNPQLMKLIYDTIGLKELNAVLNEVVDICTALKEKYAKDEEQREQRQPIIRKQDKAFFHSLSIVRAKDAPTFKKIKLDMSYQSN